MSNRSLILLTLTQILSLISLTSSEITFRDSLLEKKGEMKISVIYNSKFKLFFIPFDNFVHFIGVILKVIFLVTLFVFVVRAQQNCQSAITALILDCKRQR